MLKLFSIGLGFAIPSELVDQVTNTLINEGRVSRGWLGVTIGNVSDDMADAVGLGDTRGAIVSSVTEDSPADVSGLERGDIIVKVNGTQVDDATTTTRLVGALAVGSKNKFEIYRDGKRRVIDVTVGDRSKGLGQVTTLASSRSSEPEENESGPLGVTLTPLDDEARERLDLGDDEKGMLITDLDSDSALYDAGVREGMAILDVNYNKLDSIDVLEEELEEVRSSDRSRLLLAIQAEGTGTRFVAIDVEEDE
ncbi:MAG: PDZ domain-containing protein [Henriciella sp.]|nr:PDZ domain-containing protein [Henriciella sp.]